MKACHTCGCKVNCYLSAILYWQQIIFILFCWFRNPQLLSFMRRRHWLTSLSFRSTWKGLSIKVVHSSWSYTREEFEEHHTWLYPWLTTWCGRGDWCGGRGGCNRCRPIPLLLRHRWWWSHLFPSKYKQMGLY